jgi:outer membrane protein OmpA-like peptidoglycan-associated protein
MKIISVFLTVCGLAAAQSPQASTTVQQSSDNAARMAAVAATPDYRVSVVARTTKAINYNHRGGATTIDFRGTTLAPEARGEATVESQQGAIKIDARLQGLPPAAKFGPEFLTYVMWAISPEGRATNVGEILVEGDRTKLDATTELQSFALIVTAEPYFAVTRPSDAVVMENVVRQDAAGTMEQVDAKYELLQRGQYTLNADQAEVKPLPPTAKAPLELYEARNAVRIARWTGAERYATDAYEKAAEGLQNAEGYLTKRTTGRNIDTVAREAVQMAEDSRIVAIKRIHEEMLANERQAGPDREARAATARAEAQASAEKTTESARQRQFEAQSDANQIKRQSDAAIEIAQNAPDRADRNAAAQTAAVAIEAGQSKRENNAMAVPRGEAQASAQNAPESARQAQFEAQSDANQVKRQSDAAVEIAQNAADRADRNTGAQMAAARIEVGQSKGGSDATAVAAQAEADRLKRDSDVQALAARSEADGVKIGNDAQRSSAAKEKADLRGQLLAQFDAVLQTRDTPRGLVVNIPDALFDAAKFSLLPLAREKLAELAGIVARHPGLRLDVEGYTDSVGGDDYNQRISEQRGEAVRNYLTQEGMALGSITAKGFGRAEPVASNDTAAGRQQNRRVEIVISGEIIGTEIGAPLAAR